MLILYIVGIYPDRTLNSSTIYNCCKIDLFLLYCSGQFLYNAHLNVEEKKILYRDTFLVIKGGFRSGFYPHTHHTQKYENCTRPLKLSVFHVVLSAISRVGK